MPVGGREIFKGTGPFSVRAEGFCRMIAYQVMQKAIEKKAEAEAAEQEQEAEPANMEQNIQEQRN